MKRVLLTGAAGAIGTHFIAHFMTNTDWELVLVDSFNPVHKGRFDRIAMVCRNHPDWPARMKTIVHDLRAPFTAREIEQMGKIDYVVNLASRSDVQNSIDDPYEFVRNNFDIAMSMAHLGLMLNPEKFLHFSTDEVYGPAPKDSKGHKEWDIIAPSNPYSSSKAIQEVVFFAWWRSFGLRYINTNTMNNFGEMQAPSKFPAMIQNKLKRGETIKVHASTTGEIGTRYYLHSRNAADAVMFILKNVPVLIHSPGHIDLPERLNIVGDRQVSNLELVQIIGRLMGIEPKYELAYFHEDNPGHDLHYGLDGSKLAALGWVPLVSFETSLKNTIEWGERHPDWL